MKDVTSHLRIAIVSGKGGTGKTTVATALAQSLDGEARLVDCDVEEPNCHLFLKPKIVNREIVTIMVPEIAEELCTACGACAEFCRYGALACFGKAPLLFSELCHGCGGCILVCPTGALRETRRRIGVAEEGNAGVVPFSKGELDVREAMAPPLIRAVKEKIPHDRTAIIDGPPGTSCSVVTTVHGCDYAILVADPTPFGLHDLKLTVEMINTMGIPSGVIINRSTSEDQEIHEFCRQEGIPILLEIPDDRKVAEACSRGESLLVPLPSLRKDFIRTYRTIQKYLKETAPATALSAGESTP